MKKLLLILIVCLVSFQSYCQDFQMLDNSKIDSAKMKIAQKFSNDFYTQLSNGSYYKFNDEAIPQIKNQMTEDFQKATYKQIKDNFGDFVSLNYSETWIQTSNPKMFIFRFKGKFNKSNDDLEIRVVIIENGKIAGFFIKPWNNKLQ